MKKWKQQLEVVLWAIRLAVQINGKVLFLWLSISIIAAILPAVSLHFNRASAAILSAFLTTGQGEFSDIVPSLVGLGVTMVLIGASNRINQGFLYLVMYDDYYLGLAEYLMDHVQKVELKTLMDKDYADSYQSSVGRAGALSDLLSTACMIVSRYCVSLCYHHLSADCCAGIVFYIVCGTANLCGSSHDFVWLEVQSFMDGQPPCSCGGAGGRLLEAGGFIPWSRKRDTNI